MFSTKTVKKVQKKLHINPLVIPPKVFKSGMKIEWEHHNITHGNALLTGKIATAHLKELPDYYQRLDRLEKQGKKYYSKHKKPNIFM
jgi:hypothetical protein